MAKSTETKDDSVTPTPDFNFIDTWKKFCEDLRSLLVTRKDARMLDQYLELRNKAIEIVTSDEFLKDMENFVKEPPLGGDKNVIEALDLEIKAFSKSKEIAFTIGNPYKKKQWWKKWGRGLLGQASIVNGSVKDNIGDSPKLKAGLTLFGEVIDIFKGDK